MPISQKKLPGIKATCRKQRKLCRPMTSKVAIAQSNGSALLKIPLYNTT